MGQDDPLVSSTRPASPPLTPLDVVVGWLRDADDATRVVLPEDARARSSAAQVSGISLSTQRVEPGDVYAALPGTRAHGAEFAAQAVAAGAVAVLTDAAGADLCARSALAVPVVVVAHPRAVLGRLSARIYGEPTRSMTMIGVTGTQGKTTTTRLAEAGLLGADVRAAVVGTVGTRIAGQDVRTSLTTPEAPDLHGLFALMRERGVDACAMEVSSHALVMGRVDGVVFDVAVFLNLGRDHLDFHRDLEDYYQAKASLFKPEHARLALINVDDEHGRRLAGETSLPVRTFSARGRAADWCAVDVRVDDLEHAGSSFVIRRGRETEAPDVAAAVPLPGEFNVENALAAIAACAETGHDAEQVAAGLRRADVPGRMQRLVCGQSFTVVVDYAHKPDAVEAAIAALRPVAAARGGRLVVVLGAGGDRDRGKRPVMGEITARLADVFILTDDNPRSEDPAQIRAAVRAGVAPGGAEVLEIGDRSEAIATAIARAGEHDVVLIAGKGHEKGQEIDGVVHPFDDQEVAEAALAARTGELR
ncbi:MAG: UDP-N-acetylmuramoyl-L-alanyl-D-glutamate--2,6-diaminopimelate ligase [Pimelobacter sp.]|nr:UDP-N-acetylmuramoyl-L-alanyl-D-glutamate--2,6-diaminopimelate ligase [Pimelobacter sp.]